MPYGGGGGAAGGGQWEVVEERVGAAAVRGGGSWPLSKWVGGVGRGRGGWAMAWAEKGGEHPREGKMLVCVCPTAQLLGGDAVREVFESKNARMV